MLLHMYRERYRLRSGCQDVKKKVYGPFMRVCHVLDDNRYNASRGAHLNLKRAEKARILVNKVPALVDSLVAKTGAWEEENELTFAYDGVPLLAMLDEYALLRHDSEEEKRWMRIRKFLHFTRGPEEIPPTAKNRTRSYLRFKTRPCSTSVRRRWWDHVSMVVQ